jgi:hypothetical protein
MRRNISIHSTVERTKIIWLVRGTETQREREREREKVYADNES